MFRHVKRWPNYRAFTAAVKMGNVPNEKWVILKNCTTE